MTDSDNSESLRQRQEDELEVIKSIFPDDVVDLRDKDPWKVWRPPEGLLTLRPEHSISSSHQATHVQVDLYFKCQPRYPYEKPILDFRNPRGLSDQLLGELRVQLDLAAESLLGMEMMYELAQRVQTFLRSHNRPQFQSFFEEMTTNQRLRKEQEDRDRCQQERMTDEIQIKAIQEEIQRKKELLEEEIKRHKELKKNANNEDVHFSLDKSPSTNHLTSGRRRSKSGGDHCPDHNYTSSISFDLRHGNVRNIQRGSCLGHSERGCVKFNGVDTRNGELLVVSQWVLKWKQLPRRHSSYDFHSLQQEMAPYFRQVCQIEQEMNVLSKLSHPNLAAYIALSHHKERDHIIVYVLEEFVMGCPLTHFLVHQVPLGPAQLRLLALNIVSGLHHLHSSSVVHRNLRPSSVFITQSGAIKIADYSIDKRLQDLHLAVLGQELPTEQKSLGKLGKKGDIYRLGLLLLSLSQGRSIEEELPSIPGSLHPDLQDFLSKCMEPDKSYPTDQLLQHPFLGESLQVTSPTDNRQLVLNNESEEEDNQPVPMFIPQDSQSRLHNEFEILKWLGKGGFGDVLKVRNKLDGRPYAIKKILLNPSSKHFNRKIKQEVKLLSRLNHENVVRYYNSWIEYATMPNPETPTTDEAATTNTTNTSSHSQDSLEQLAPPRVENSVDWSSYAKSSKHPLQEDTSSEEEDEEDGEFCSPFKLFSEMSDSVVFERDGTEEPEEEEPSTQEEVSTHKSPEVDKTSSPSIAIPLVQQYMFIQMEFCEKSTLRTAIDGGLYKEPDRMWRMFREIVEGLVHIHQQGMIHRDLKPVNIFLDLHDHVKIGDFGLATMDVVAKPNLEPGSTDLPLEVSQGGGMTGRVGTALYLAPELSTKSSGKIIYNQKVDIYSLGIIFFEMCSPPPATAMERVKMLLNLHQKDILLPQQHSLTTKQVKLVRWLLTHDLNLRPTSMELYHSEYIPPLQMEEEKVDAMVRQLVAKPNTRAYKHLLEAMFSSPRSPLSDITYDLELSSGQRGAPYSRHHRAHLLILAVAEKIMSNHGAVHYNVPTLLPRHKASEHVDTYVKMMDTGGGIIHLPHDLRVPFARHVALRGITSLKRFCVSKVFRQRKALGFHPRELYELAFDIVSPDPSSLAPDAEVINIVAEILAEIPTFNSKNIYLRMNHMQLLRGLCQQAGIPVEKHIQFFNLLSHAKSGGMPKSELHQSLAKLAISDHSLATLSQIIDLEAPSARVGQALRNVFRRKTQPIISLARQGMAELEAIEKLLEVFGFKYPVKLAPTLVFGVGIFSGVFFQFVCENKKRHRTEILAAGGRYDELIAEFQRANPCKDVHQSAVGVSLGVDKLSSSLSADEEWVMPTLADVVVCSLGNKPLLTERGALLRDLWAAGIRADMMYEPPRGMEEVTEVAKVYGAQHIVILKDSDPGFAKVRSTDKEKVYMERRIAIIELVDFLQRLLSAPSKQTDSGDVIGGGSGGRGDISRNPSSSSDTGGGASLVKITFIPFEEKLSSSLRRRHEGQIQKHITPLLPKLAAGLLVEVLVLDLPLSVVSALACQIQMDGDEATFSNSVLPIVEKYPRHRKYIDKIADEILELRFHNKAAMVVVLYSLPEGRYRVLL